MRLQPLIIILFCLATISFSKTVWEYQLDAPASTNGMVFSTGILIGSQDGFAYLLSTQNGKPIWKKYVGSPLLNPIIFGDEAAVITQNGKLSFFKPDGSTRLSLTIPLVKTVYGAVADGDTLYATTNIGVFKILRAGNISKIYSENTTFTEPAIFNHNAVFGKGNELVMLNPNGGVVWRVNVGTVWKRPVTGANTIYVGTTDKEIVAISNGGNVLWKTVLGGYSAAPLLSQGNIWAAGSDWKIYRTNGITKEEYVTPHGDFMNTPPVSITVNGQEGIAFGGKYQVLMFNQNGMPVFSYPVRGTVVSLGTRLQNSLIIGDSTGKIMLADADKGCAILNPKGEDILGKQEQKVQVAAFSKTDTVNSVEVRVNEGEWKTLDEKDGVYYAFLPNTLFSDFSNSIECRTTDSQGTQTEPFGQVEIYKDPSLPLQRMRIDVKDDPIENTEIEVAILGDRGTALEHVTMTINGERKQVVDGSLRLSLQKGEYTLKAEKEGYTPATTKITARSLDQGSGSLLPIVAAGILIVVGLFIFLRRAKNNK